MTPRFAPVALLLLIAFAIPGAAQVTGTGTATLTWQPPTQYTNGDPLPVTDIEKFTIYWGRQPGSYSDSVDVENGAVQSRTLEVRISEPTTFYFAMTATARGLESAYSNEVSKTITLEFDDSPPGAPQSVTVEITLECETAEPGRTCRLVVE